MRSIRPNPALLNLPLLLLIAAAGCQNGQSQFTVIKPDEQRPVPAEAVRTSAPGDPANGDRTHRKTPLPAADALAGQTEEVSGGVIELGEQFLIAADILNPLSRQLRRLADNPQEFFRREAAPIIAREVRDQVNHQLLFAEADRRLNEDEKKYVQGEFDQRYKLAVAENGGSRATLEARLAQEGLQLSRWEKEFKNSLLVQFYVEKKFGKQITINRRMMLEYYNNHLGEYSSAETAQMQIIDLPVREFLPTTQPVEAQDVEAARLQARRQAELASAELAQGKDFAQVAKKYSKAARSDEGGVFPVMERGSFKREEVEKVVFEQQAGQVSGIIQTNTDFYIVKTLQAATPGQAVPFENLQGSIEQSLRNEAYQRLLGNYLKTLQTDSQRQATDKFAAACLEAAVKQYHK